MEKLIKKGMKPISFGFLALYCLVFLMALVFMTNYYWIVEADSIGKKVYAALQNVNDMLMYTGIIGIVSFGVFAIFSSTSRRYYYKSNLVVNIAGSVVSAVFAIITLVMLVMILPDFSANLDEFKEISMMLGKLNVDYTCIILAILSLVLAVAGSVLYCIYTVLKYSATVEHLKEKVVECDAR